MGSDSHHLPSSQQTSVSRAFVGIFFHVVPPELYIQISYSAILFKSLILPSSLLSSMTSIHCILSTEFANSKTQIQRQPGSDTT
jgi:hypothetical protein